MKIQKLEAGERLFAPLFLDYINQKENLKPFYAEYPNLDNFRSQIEKRTLDPEIRESLVAVLVEQYDEINAIEEVKPQLESLRKSNTFTVTTGHQLNLFTGPSYFIYKIISIINLAKRLKEAYPDHHFIPVYWMATEDHDFAEINHFHLFGNTYSWESQQTGPVGRFSTTDLKKVIDEVKEDIPEFKLPYQETDNLSAATRKLVHQIFGDQGLIILDADHPELKQHFVPVIEADILDQKTKPLAEECTAKLTEQGYSAPVHIREINFFYLEDGLRERIVQEEDAFKVLNTDKKFTRAELKEKINDNPECFSPNVALRPVYQEMILPNLAYLGGPSEVAYWLQLKPVFDQFEVFYPMLFPRNFAMIINKNNLRKIEKLELKWEDLFLSTDLLKNKYITDQADGLLELEDEKAQLSTIFSSLKQKAEQIDQSLADWIGSEESKSLKSLDHIQKRLKKAEKNNQDTAIKQIENIKSKLWPEGTLQERHDNILNFYINNRDLLDFLLQEFDPFDFRFNLVLEDD